MDTSVVTDRQNCGNLLAGVGPFAIERGIVVAAGSCLAVRIRMLNTGEIAVAHVPLRDGRPTYEGGCAIDGVPGTSAAIRLGFERHDLSTPSVFPTGNRVDRINDVDATCVSNGMPVVILRAGDIGVAGDEPCAELEENVALRTRVESIRVAAGALMGLGDVSDLTVPKMTLVSRPTAGGIINT